MNDTITVRQACDHGYYAEHATLTRTIIPIDSHQEVVGKTQNQWCPGGKERHFREVHIELPVPTAGPIIDAVQVAWVEMDDDEKRGRVK